MTTSSDNLFQVGDVLNGKWVILEFIDKGGMGEVYRAHQVNLNRDVAIKVMLKEWLEALDKDDKEAETLAQRFRREVQVMAQISHPNVLQIFDYDSVTVKKSGQDMPIEYIAMEYVPGGSLRATMSEEGFYPDQAAIGNWITNYFFPVLVGVQALHDLEIVHRDLKPENILMEKNIPKIADFGLASSCRLKPVTQSIDVKGSPQYMSPEHFFDFKRADKRADVYSLGKILFEAVEGKIKLKAIPFKISGLAKTESPFLQQLDRIIQSATAENREERIESVQDLLQQLEQVVKVFELSASPDRRRLAPLHSRPKWLWAGIAVATLSVMLIAIWHFMGMPGWDVAKGGFSRGGDVHESHTKSDNVETAAKPDTVAASPAPKHAEEQHVRDLIPFPQDAEKASTVSEHEGKEHLISGGKFIIPASASGSKKQQTVQVKPFYMDEFLVTNQQFVNFLNHNLSRISLEKEVVKGDGANWFLLGEVSADYEPIVFQNGKYHVNDPADASNPALRVTGYGATAFAKFYDRRLPTEAELLFVMIKGASQENKEEALEKAHREWHHRNPGIEIEPQANTEESKTHSSKEPLPRDRSAESRTAKRVFSAALLIPNTLGIRGLNDETIGEWVSKSSTASSEDPTQMNQYAVIGGLEVTLSRNANPSSKTVARSPWEGSEFVGFRTTKAATTVSQ